MEGGARCRGHRTLGLAHPSQDRNERRLVHQSASSRRHHFIFKLFLKADHVLNLLNLLFLMCICFLPFPTEVLARFLDDPYNRETVLYCRPPSGRWHGSMPATAVGSSIAISRANSYTSCPLSISPRSPSITW